MSRSEIIHIMTRQTFERISKVTGKPPGCQTCRKPIQQGDYYISKQRRLGAHYRHEECARRVNLI